MLIGERITGQTSGAVAIVAEIVDASTISYIYKNESVFLEGETLILPSLILLLEFLF